jgi:hypothetical protein
MGETVACANLRALSGEEMTITFEKRLSAPGSKQDENTASKLDFTVVMNNDKPLPNHIKLIFKHHYKDDVETFEWFLTQTGERSFTASPENKRLIIYKEHFGYGRVYMGNREDMNGHYSYHEKHTATQYLEYILCYDGYEEKLIDPISNSPTFTVTLDWAR